MVNYKDETSPEALERVMGANIDVDSEVVRFSDWQDAVEKNIPTGLKSLWKGKLKEELSNKYFKEHIEKVKEEPIKGSLESADAYEKRRKQYVQNLRESRKRFKVSVVLLEELSKSEQKTIKEFQEKTFFAPIKLEQKSVKGKTYSRSFMRWTDQQEQFVTARIGRSTAKKIANEYNNHFGQSRPFPSIQTKISRLKKK